MHEKPNNFRFQPGPIQTGLYIHRRWLEAGNFGFRKYRNCTILVAKAKALISFAFTAKLFCTFVFAYADCWFSYATAHVMKMSLIVGHIISLQQTSNAPCIFVSMHIFHGDRFLCIAELAYTRVLCSISKIDIFAMIYFQEIIFLARKVKINGSQK